MIKIFLVEDEIIIREAIHKMIPWEEYGFEFAGEAKDGEMALPAIRSIRPDVLITDIKMPFMDGLVLSRLVLKELPDTKIIIVSGYDDFEYARQAISLGVEQYLLKPVTKSAFIEVLEKIREKYEKEVEQKDYFEKFQNDIREYEKNTRRDFFEMLVSGKADLTEIYEKAEQLEIDILSECYNLVLFSVMSGEKQKEIVDAYTPELGELLTEIDVMFQKDASYLLFRNQMFSYAVLVKAPKSEVMQCTESCMDRLTGMFELEKDRIDWFICHASPVDRLSLLPKCYQEAMKAFALRYVGYSHVISCEETDGEQEHADVDLRAIDTDAVNPDLIRNFLCQALPEEVESFVSNYVHLIGEDALKSQMFRQYIMLNVYFCVVSFVQGLGFDKMQFQEEIQDIHVVGAESDWRTANSASMKETFSEANGYELIFDDAQQKQENQIAAIRNFIQQEVDYIVLAPVTETGWDTVLQEAYDAGIPVIIVDRMVNISNEDLYTAWVGSNFQLEGEKACAWLDAYAQATGKGEEQLNIIDIQGTIGASAQIGRTAGLEAAIESHDNWTLLEAQSGEFTQAKGQEVMESLLKQYDDIDVVYCENDNEAFGAIDAIEAAGKTVGKEIGKDILVMSFDSTNAGLTDVLDGKIICNTECNPLHGPRVEEIIKKLEAGEEVEKQQFVDEEIFAGTEDVASIKVTDAEGNEAEYPVTTVTQEVIDGRAY